MQRHQSDVIHSVLLSAAHNFEGKVFAGICPSVHKQEF